ncbi:patatin-like phospholipase family protein [Cupriavidus sp. CV2]|uniref:patatin-like phospholipase family protein n=1 Tax=Cupriavidus ulmosensis TaxID=3065913 RepID=UPI00296AAC84|nr:patatin-like phospholipase family protein [Cupriavidus sp. CV2]MDW3684309.1 patatin-like phospholipase family protein [Cupriavidus sp. CV2]
MAQPRKATPSNATPHGEKFAHTVLVLQGGGALGAYQAGIYAGLADAGIAPDWIAGVSIGAINAALIAGNPPERRVERLGEFWDRISAHTPFMPPAYLEHLRPMMNVFSAASAVTFGVPGFFSPRVPPPFLSPDGTIEALSYYDTRPLRDTLERLVDFELINRKDVRLSLGAVNVRSGNSVYFDNAQMRLGPEHVMASGALPPGFPPVEVGGELYWDGGIVSNTPLWYVVDEDYRMNALVLQVDVFSGAGEAPLNLRQAQERVKDIQYASKTRFNTNRVREIEELRGALHRVIGKLPAALKSDPDVERLTAISTRGAVALLHFINRHNTQSANFKDYEFSRATVTDLWNGGLEDARRAIASPKWKEAMELASGIGIYDMTIQ